ncbi:helix-turn-helix domain-containing protein [Saccharothrix sp.]|uniref:winged helix-turn-helix transcriptional regulator n=1 Tax=Saccharothrix sp. TaxID=1873460 RepID=UPI0028110EF6|nr:helix-turn-helix domain-containing protein [Saccharothrix sp.]
MRAERAGLVHRDLYPSVPPKVEYSLTPLGQDVGVLMDAIRVWAEDHIEDIRSAQIAYDAKAGEELQPV